MTDNELLDMLKDEVARTDPGTPEREMALNQLNATMKTVNDRRQIESGERVEESKKLSTETIEAKKMKTTIMATVIGGVVSGLFSLGGLALSSKIESEGGIASWSKKIKDNLADKFSKK